MTYSRMKNDLLAKNGALEVIAPSSPPSKFDPAEGAPGSDTIILGVFIICILMLFSVILMHL